jgi:glucosamine--fructose-6-phosphate aminotransferase (isomerizing)
MCGIFGIISGSRINTKNLKKLVKHSQQRGKDSSGLITYNRNNYFITRADYEISKLLERVKPYESKIVLGHSRLVTNGMNDNQPVLRNGLICIHNGIIVNEEEIWQTCNLKRQLQIDSEAILALAEFYLNKSDDISGLAPFILARVQGVVACALLVPRLGKLILFSNNGSLYYGWIDRDFYFASEKYGLNLAGCQEVVQLKGADTMVVEIPESKLDIQYFDENVRKENLIPSFQYIAKEEKILEYNTPILKRCSRCVLPETMPFIKFDDNGECNYCKHYKTRNSPKPKEELFKLVEPYRRKGKELDCIVPFSGGRDSCYGLHLIVNELKMKPVTYTYDWGMVTDLGRRNISRMCSQLGVENIIVAADISMKRRNIRMNLKAWLKSPHLGMMAMLTAGDKHFFRHVETIKKQTGININLWGVNPLEVTHFKTGFLGIEPDFEEKRVYSHGVSKQLRYHGKRFKAMLESPGYFNLSLWDTLSGEYFRSFTEKNDYFHIFDFWRWDENQVNDTLLNEYDWEKALDTPTTWRIGDGTAAFYNYVYYTVAGFTEHDTFRSNQVREGQITREKALELLIEENKPRYQSVRWYLDTLQLDFETVVNIVNNIPKLYQRS